MIEQLATLNFWSALGSVGMGVIAVVLLFDLYRRRLFAEYVRRYGIPFAFFLTLFASLITLVYSEYFGIIPCGLCWLQRVFTYSQVFILGTAWHIRDQLFIARYGIALSLPGAIVSLYQHYLQMGGSQFVTCPTAGAGADCAKRYVFEFGFVTFPLMAFFLFALLIALYMYLMKISSSQKED